MRIKKYISAGAILLPGLFLLLTLPGCGDDLVRTNPWDPETTMKTFIEEGHDTLWVANRFTAADSPYFISSNLYIASRLEVEAGTVINCAPGVSIIVMGGYRPDCALVAIGTEEQPIRFTTNSSGQWGGIHFLYSTDAKSVLSNCIIKNNGRVPTLYLSTDSVLVQDCRIESADIQISGSPVVENCSLFQSFVEVHRGAPLFRGNSINGEIFSTNGGTLKLSGNSIWHSRIYLKEGTAEITGNSLDSSEVQFLGGVSAVVEYNSFSGGQWAQFVDVERAIWVRSSGSPDPETGSNSLEIHNNNFLDQTGHAISLQIIGGTGEVTQSADVAAENNYWGTGDSGAIEALLYDASDDGTAGMGRIVYQPFSSSPIAGAGAD